MICDECETVAHCMKNGCVPKQPAHPLKTVLEMARESKVVPVLLVPHGEYFKFLEHFAALIRADERSSWPAEMEAMERQVNILTDALAQAKADEREACAKAAEDFLTKGRSPLGKSVAAAIRARSNT